MNCRLPKKIGTPSGGGGGTGGLAFVITDETSALNSSSFYLTINGTKYYTAQTVEVSEGTVVTVTATRTMGVMVNGTQAQYFASGGSYEFTVTTNTTFGTFGSSSYGVYANFTTEGSSGGGTTPSEIAATVTGTGNATYCYLTYNGTKYTSATTLAVKVGDTISFTTKGCSYGYGRVAINGTNVHNTASSATYNWTVPSGVNAISIKLTYTTDGSVVYQGVITVTTS